LSSSWLLRCYFLSSYGCNKESIAVIITLLVHLTKFTSLDKSNRLHFKVRTTSRHPDFEIHWVQCDMVGLVTQLDGVPTYIGSFGVTIWLLYVTIVLVICQMFNSSPVHLFHFYILHWHRVNFTGLRTIFNQVRHFTISFLILTGVLVVWFNYIFDVLKLTYNFRALVFVANNFGGKLSKITLTDVDLELLVHVTKELRRYVENLEQIKLVFYSPT